MPDRLKSTPQPPPPWNEGDSIRETLVIYFDTPDARETLRSFGRLLFDLCIEASHPAPRLDAPDEPSLAYTEMRAVAVDLRFLEGYLDNVVDRSADESSLTARDESMARFGGRLARRVGAIAEAIERELS
jgi:hypothetical protein